MTTRRLFLQRSAALAAAGLLLPGRLQAQSAPLFQISLAQWSLHKTFFDGKADPLDFAKIARDDYGIDAVEYVNQFYKAKKNDNAYLAELKKRTADLGVRNVLIMCDGEGNLGDADPAARKQAVANHHRWVEWAKELGCHAIRVNASSSGSYWEQVERAADGLRQLSEFAADHQISVIVENHGGLSSNGSWLAEVMRKVAHPGCGTLPDFGNFRVSKNVEYDRYVGTRELMPFAKGVSAKSHDFDDKGNETGTDYRKMLPIVLSFGYRGYVGIEYEGSRLSERDGIIATKKLLETVRAEISG